MRGKSGTSDGGEHLTPMRRQYLALKRQHPDAILFFRLGDFYETFDADAELVSRVLRITLTSREVGKGQRVPLAGVPYHAVESYLARLVAAGYRVAICEQLDPTPRIGSAGRFARGNTASKDMMAREVVRVVTPGTVVEPRLLEASRNNYLCALVAGYGSSGAPQYGLAYADVTTGEFAVAELTGEEAAAELARELERLQPAECVIPKTGPQPEARSPRSEVLPPEPPQDVGLRTSDSPTLEAQAVAGRHVTPLEPWRFEWGTAQEVLCRQFGVTSLEGFGCAGKPLAVRAAGALVAYVEETNRPLLALLDGIRTYEPGTFMRLDGFTRRNLELLEPAALRRAIPGRDPAAGGDGRPTLFSVVDDTKTPMGGRLLRQWVGQPLLDLGALRTRHDVVAALVDDGVLRGRIRAILQRVADVERLTNRVRQGSAYPRELLALRQSFIAAQELQSLAEDPNGWRANGGRANDGPATVARGLVPRNDVTPSIAVEEEHQPNPHQELRQLLASIDPCAEVADLIGRAVYEPTEAEARRASLGTWEEERLIKTGYSVELDDLVRSSADARNWIAGLESAERERTGIKSLKVGFNKVFGYYLHVSHAYKGEIPAHYIRRQTLTDGERYITPELKEYENLVLHAQERIGDLERQIYADVQRQIAQHAPSLLKAAATLARLDVLAGFAEVALRRNFVRPELDGGEALELIQGRHPVVEAALDAATAQLGQPARFVPNDCHLSTDGEQIVILTGPNMAGKCLSSDTLVFTDGGLVPIDQLRPADAEEGRFTDLSCRVRGLHRPALATHFYTGGRQATVRMTTRLGYQIEGTPEHRVWVRHTDGHEAWQRLGDLAPGDIIAVERHIDLWGSSTDTLDAAASAAKLARARRSRLPAALDEDLAYLMGLLVGDGTVTYRNAVNLSTADEFIADSFARIVDRLFGYRIGRKQNGKDFFVASRQIRVFLEQLGLDYCAAHQKRVPRSIMRAPRAQVVAFLQGLFDTDGYADKRYGNVELSTASEQLAKEVQLLLLNLGIVASRRRKPTPRRPAFTVSAYGADAIAFHERVGFRLPSKRARAALASTVRMPNVGGIPYLTGALKQVQQRIAATPGKSVALKRDKSVNSIFYTYLPSGRNISYRKLDELVAYCADNGVASPELADLQRRRLLYDRVTSVQPGEADVYDLNVAEDHAYVAGGLVSHNSTYLRATALIVLLAQSGSFVPAQTARIGLVDRIFTRVGAQDDLAAGQSTFMVEMLETASILRHATRRSLVILDEIGRGTSTYDGVAIAQSVVEYLHGHSGHPAGSDQWRQRAPRSVVSDQWREGGPRTLFATHYHELAELEQALARVRNYRMDVLEDGEQVVFLHRVVAGSADRSYGIHVARLAGVPRPVTQRAAEVLRELEAQRLRVTATAGPSAGGTTAVEESGDGLTDVVDTEPAGHRTSGQRSGRANGHALALVQADPISDLAAPVGRAVQLALFVPSHPLLDELKALDVMNMTPLEALNRLADLVKRSRET